jgi:hypothetical protein
MVPITRSRAAPSAVHVAPPPNPVKAREPVSPDEDEPPELPPPVPVEAAVVVVVAGAVVVVVDVEPVVPVVVVVVVVEEPVVVPAVATPANATFWAPFGPVTTNVAVAVPTLLGENATETWQDAPAASVQDEGVIENAPFPPVTEACTFIDSPDAHTSTDVVVVAPDAAVSLTLNGNAPTGSMGVTWDQVK